MAKSNFRVDTLQALSAAILAYEQNGCFVVRVTEDGKVDNKMFITNFFSQNRESNSALLERAEQVRQCVAQKVMMNQLIGARNNDFLFSVHKTISEDTVSNRDFGLVAWAPKLVNDIEKNDNLREQLLQVGMTSQFIGKLGKKIETNFNLISIKYLVSYDSFIHFGEDGQGNLIMFFSRKKIESGGPISARVKQHQRDEKLANSCVTVVNYVKVLDA